MSVDHALFEVYSGVPGPPAWLAPVPWATATAYAVGPPASLVTVAGSSYVALVAHTSGVFATDLADGKWELVASGGNSELSDSTTLGTLTAEAAPAYLLATNPAGNRVRKLLTTVTGLAVLAATDAAGVRTAIGAEAAGTAATAMTAHLAAGDPHPQYTTAAELSAYAQPLDGDLTALAALTGTNTLYYRSAANTWSPVTIGSNLTFASGTLAASGGSASLPITIPPLIAAGETKILFSNTHPTMNYIFTSNLQTSAGADFANLVYQDWGFNGNADGRTNPALPAMSSDIEGCWSPGSDSWIFEPHMLKVNVGAPGSTIAVRADTWYIPNPNKATYFLQHVVSAHAHEFMCFTNSSSGGTVDSSFLMRLSKGSVALYANQVGIYEDADQIRIATDGQRLSFSAAQLDFVGFDYSYETANTVTFKKPAIFRNYGGAGTRILLDYQPSGNDPLLVALERDAGGAPSWSGGFNANGQVQIGWVSNPSIAGNRRGLFAFASGSYNQLGFCDSNGNVFQVIQVATDTFTPPGYHSGTWTGGSASPMLRDDKTTGNSGATAYTFEDVVRRLKDCNLLAA